MNIQIFHSRFSISNIPDLVLRAEGAPKISDASLKRQHNVLHDQRTHTAETEPFKDAFGPKKLNGGVSGLTRDV